MYGSRRSVVDDLEIHRVAPVETVSGTGNPGAGNA